MKKYFSIILSVFFTSIWAADAPGNGCLLEAKYLYDECIKRRNASALKWEIGGSIENGCQMEVKKIKDQCLKQYNYKEGEYHTATGTNMIAGIPVLVPNSLTTNSSTLRNAQTCTFKSLLERIYQRTQSSQEQMSIRKKYITSLEAQNFSESILSLGKIEKKIMMLEEYYIPLKNSFENSTIPRVDAFLKMLGYGSQQNISDPSITMTINELVQLNLNERKNADEFILQIETMKSSLENLFISIRDEIEARELLEKNKAKATENFSNTIKGNTLKTINLADNFNLLLNNNTPTFSGTQSIDLYPISDNDVSEMVKNLHLLALVSGKAIHLLSESQQPAVAPSFSLSISSDALYLAEEVKFRSDYVSNIVDFDECTKFNDLSNPDNQQESHLVRNLLLSMQTSILAARLSESRETLLEMNIWNHQFTNQEKSIREKKIKIFLELLKSVNTLKDVAGLKMEHAKAWKKLIDLIEIRSQTCAGVITPTPIATPEPVFAPLAHCPTNAISILKEAQSLQKVVDSYHTTAKNQLASLTMSVSQIRVRLSEAQSFGDVRVQNSVVANQTSKSSMKMVDKYLRPLKINFTKDLFSINPAWAVSSATEQLDVALGITSGSRYQSFFDLTKQTHKSIMLGQNKSYPDYEMSNLLKRSNYLSFTSLFALSAYKDMAQQTYTRMIANSEKNAEILAAINHDSFKGFSTDMGNQYQKTLQSIIPQMAIVGISPKSTTSVLPAKLYFSGQTAKMLRHKREMEIAKVSQPTQKNSEKKFYESNYYNEQNIKSISSQISKMTLTIVDNLYKIKSQISIQELSLLDKIKNQNSLLKQSSDSDLPNSLTAKTQRDIQTLTSHELKVKEPQVKTPVVALGDITPNKVITSLKKTVATEKNTPSQSKNYDIFYKPNGQTKNSIDGTNESIRNSPTASLWEIISETYRKVAYPQLIENNR